jgi:trehalose 6-phosphate synthase/phosphatase
MQILEKK